MDSHPYAPASWIPDEHGDEPPSNPSDNRTFRSVMDSRIQRRDVMRGGLSAAILALMGSAAPNTGLASGLLAGRADAASPLLDFTAVATGTDDTIVVPPGYSARPLIPWGTPITGAMPSFSLANSGADQAQQTGSHHDGMHFFPIDGRSPWDGSSDDGLLVLNHEYVEPRFMHRAAIGQALDSDGVPMVEGQRDANQVLKEINGHGVSVVRIRQGQDGGWSVVADPRNRRITGLTPMELAGPVRGAELVRTKYSPDGTRTRGTLNNCAHGVTPWNTYMTAEENWAGYFRNGDQED
ncbi:MAG: DUF839 domain-containing protein, partial [Alphaproteobacteria bacterium]